MLPPYNRNFRTCFASVDYGSYNKQWLDFVYASLSQLVPNPLSSIEGLVQQMDFGRSYSIDTYESHRKWRLSFTVYELHQLPSNLAKIHFINDSLFPLRYLFLYAENFLEIDDCFVPLSQYLVRFDYFKKPDNLNEVNVQGLEGRIINILPLVVIHQNYDPNHVLFTEMDKIVHRILNTEKPQLIDPLIDLIGQFRYLFAHLCPYCKGNDVIAEWIETAIYRYLGFIRIPSEPNSSIDLEALSRPSLEDFLLRYRTLLNLQIDPDKWTL